MHDRSAQVVVAMHRIVRVAGVGLDEDRFGGAGADAQRRDEGVRFGDRRLGFKPAVARNERKRLAPAVGPPELDRRGGRRSAVERLDPPARRDAVLLDRKRIERAADLDDLAFGLMVAPVAVMVVVAAAAEQPGAHGVDDEPENGDRDRLGERDRPRRDQPADRLEGDQRRDHRQHDRTGEAGEVAELARPEGEARVVGVAARQRVGERGEQQRAGVGAHMETVCDERDRAEHRPACDLDDHHCAGQRDHRPDVALALSVRGAEEDMAVGSGANVAHRWRRLRRAGRPYFAVRRALRKRETRRRPAPSRSGLGSRAARRAPVNSAQSRTLPPAEAML